MESLIVALGDTYNIPVVLLGFLFFSERVVRGCISQLILTFRLLTNPNY